MLKLALNLMLISLLAGCATKNSCPDFPIPSAKVQKTLDDIAQTDRDMWEWGNKLLDLCEQLGTCEEDKK